MKLPSEFISGNEIPVERATISRERMEEILFDYAFELNQKISALTEDYKDLESKVEAIGAGGVSLISSNPRPAMTWHDINDVSPPRDCIYLEEDKTVGRRLLVTNNIHSETRTGQMSHVWFATPIWDKSKKCWVAFDSNDNKIEGITHWFDPLNPASATISDKEIVGMSTAIIDQRVSDAKDARRYRAMRNSTLGHTKESFDAHIDDAIIKASKL